MAGLTAIDKTNKVSKSLINSSTDQPINYKEQMTLLRQSNMLWKSIAYFGVISFLLWLLFGIAFQIIFMGLSLGLFRLGFIFDPAYRLLIQILHLKGLPSHLTKPPVWVLIYSTIMLFFPLATIVLGGSFLYLAGFCAQNMVCLMLLVIRR